MPGIERVTQPTLDVLEVLLRAHWDKVQLHGWAIMKETQRAGPTVYKVLDRLEDAGWIAGEWEELTPDQPGPRRRFYRLTSEGASAAQALLTQRRPAALQPQPVLGFSPFGWLNALRTGGVS
ncbi:DNA-binding PadR family transcriptional regulator [Streptosporangium becharense]|uniref:DNA-binding PadR family transcriptional regulator n=1 Tax=Streptosporangium becharense TaxID=1816182 RepID=A0A7W9IGH0_9ACTN|nr:PadR family transcriptional regulator [Streptosporangium becharense]MBB2909360.1 DNA-binding PadR family transcriptional regulator [Streptosporangium becharense]MBB5819683.1 DNA-binding PadR family transcriptional regulator [Streptosporangium becharense]